MVAGSRPYQGPHTVETILMSFVDRSYVLSLCVSKYHQYSSLTYNDMNIHLLVLAVVKYGLLENPPLAVDNLPAMAMPWTRSLLLESSKVDGTAMSRVTWLPSYSQCLLDIGAMANISR